ncbi:MAG TPA: nuclear transport factor 2 family protein [Candidatus Binataceae bacterium]|nr:nuclear transport factor 2 family protein [Candidatus Binataceae bacterium]
MTTKSKLSLAAIASAICLIAFATASPAWAADSKAEIEALEHKCAQATSVDELMNCYEPSDDVVVYDIGTPREFDGRKAVRGDFQGFFDTIKNPKVEFVSMHVVSDGKMAMANSIQHFTGTGKDGKPIDMTFRVTDVWQKQKGQWKMIHSHVSFPTDMATGKADMQSKM